MSLNGTPTHDYIYNALGQRVVKSPVATPSNATHFHYDGGGKLIAETGASGAVVREYVYLQGLPIGQFTPGSSGSPAEVTLDNSDGGASGTAGWSTGTAGSGYLGSNYHELLPGATPSGGTTIDNSDSASKTLGIWSTQTSPSGFEGANYLRRQLSDGNGTETIVDNTDAGFSSTGTWTAGTGNMSGYYGSNATRHATNELSSGALILDNTDGAVSYTGTWATSTSVANYYGANYQSMPANTPTSGDVVVDNGGTGSSSVGAWTLVNHSSVWGGNYRESAAGTGADVYTWTPTLPAAKAYNVYARWRDLSSHASNAPYTIYHDGGSTTVTANQRDNSFTWVLLGTFNMTPGQNHRVELSDDADGKVIADAVAFHDAAAPGNVATYAPTLTETGGYRLYVRTPHHSSFAGSAPYTVYHDGGSSTVTVDQTVDGGVWKLLGTYNMTPGQNHRVELSDRALDTVVADAIAFEWTGLAPPTATWTPALARRDLYDVQARWPLSVPFKAPEANYKAVHEGGGTTITVNQQTNTGQWNTLSSGLILDPALGHRLELSGKASGPYVYADAARFVPSALPRNVTWDFTPSSTGAHLVYAKWPAAATHTTEAKFTIAHAGGSADVHVNQRIMGGQWVLLGSFTMNASTAYSIALSDNPNGQVAADAVRVVPVVASTEKFTWTPTIPSSGSYDVYARWVASSANTGSATYTVTHAGGATNVVVNQKQNGGTWIKLGAYSFVPSSGHKVELLGANDGRVVADGIRLVAASAQAANIAYIHSDHLGSPQKMTDTSQALVWDGQFDPFGEEFLISGSATMPNRFPGQYADAETGYSFNYFRYYNHAIGRYIQSDPIGLQGGINRYAYVGSSPMNAIDFFGLEIICKTIVLDSWIKEWTKEERTIIAEYRLPEPRYVGLSPSFDPSVRNPTKLPLGVDITVEFWMVLSKKIQTDVYRMRQEWIRLYTTCNDTCTGFFTESEKEIANGPVQKQLIDSYVGWSRRDLYKIAITGISPFPPD